MQQSFPASIKQHTPQTVPLSQKKNIRLKYCILSPLKWPTYKIHATLLNETRVLECD